jgi:aldehyde dehydrogenase
MNTQLDVDDSTVRHVVEEVLKRLGHTQRDTAGSRPEVATTATRSATRNRHSSSKRKFGVFEDANDACEAAHAAYYQLRDQGVAARMKVVEIVKGLCDKNANSWGKMELDETKIGRLDHKIEKLQIVKLTPGVEWLRPDAMSGDHGIMLEEYTPFGVVGGVTPITHSIPTLSSNVVSIVSAGNAVVFNPHPGGARCANFAVRVFNEAIYRELEIENLICSVEEPSLESFDAISKSEQVGLLVVTGGPGVVNAAMKSGKRAVCAGPGNPPVLVDETADLDKAARDIIFGAAYDNNLLCIGEKEVFVVDAVYHQFLQAFENAGAFKLAQSQLDQLEKVVFSYEDDGGGCSHPVLNREMVGKDATDLAALAGTRAPAGTELIFAETDASHAFVVEEQMTPMIPVVRVRDVEQGVADAKVAEHGYKHSSIIHSRHVDNMTVMARELDCTLFVKNGPSTSGLGLGGEGYLTYSIATTTGEGITTPETFTRKRRCVMVDNLRIY